MFASSWTKDHAQVTTKVYACPVTKDGALVSTDTVRHVTKANVNVVTNQHIVLNGIRFVVITTMTIVFLAMKVLVTSMIWENVNKLTILGASLATNLGVPDVIWGLVLVVTKGDANTVTKAFAIHKTILVVFLLVRIVARVRRVTKVYAPIRIRLDVGLRISIHAQKPITVNAKIVMKVNVSERMVVVVRIVTKDSAVIKMKVNAATKISFHALIEMTAHHAFIRTCIIRAPT